MFVVIGNERISLEGRAETIVRWIVGRLAEIEEPEKVGLTFDCAGSAVSVEVKKRERVDAARLR